VMAISKTCPGGGAAGFSFRYLMGSCSMHLCLIEIVFQQ